MDRYPEGSLLVAGTAEAGAGGDYSVALVKLEADGNVDGSYGTVGRVVIPVGGTVSYDQAVGVEILPDLKVIVGVATETGGTPSFAFYRLNTNGSIDTTYGDSGVKIISFPSNGATLRDIALQSDGKIVGVGEVFLTAESDFQVVRLTAAGQLDTSFALDGKWDYGFDNGTVKNDIAKAVSVSSGGAILIAGTISASTSGDNDFGLVRLTSIGLLDPSFSGNGLLELSPGAFSDGVTDVETLPDGKILVGGYQDFGAGDNDFAIYKLLSDGSLDTSFSTDGYQRIAFDVDGDMKDRANAMAFDPDGDVMLGGFASLAASNTDFALVRLVNTLDSATIFSDGFESGDISAWSSSSP